MIDAEFLALLRCPETHQTLRVASNDLIARLNEKQAAGTLTKRGGEAASEPLGGGLIREDGKVLYPIYDEIPDLLEEESFLLD